MTMGEDEEGRETRDDYLVGYLDDDLEVETGETLIDPAILKPQANLVLASCPKKRNHSPSPLRLHGSSTTSTVSSSSVSFQETVDKGKITMEEASMPTIYMMSVSANSLGPEPHNSKAALASTEWKQWEQAMQEEYNSSLENKTWEVVDRPTNRKLLTGR